MPTTSIPDDEKKRAPEIGEESAGDPVPHALRRNWERNNTGSKSS
jgi:hypothetical protein